MRLPNVNSLHHIWNEILAHFRWADAFDLAAGTVLLTLLLHWLRRHSARVVIFVLCGTALCYFAAHALRLYLMMAVFRVGVFAILFALIVIFQDDLRFGFEQLAAWPRPFSRKKDGCDRWTDALINAVELLAQE